MTITTDNIYKVHLYRVNVISWIVFSLIYYWIAHVHFNYSDSLFLTEGVGIFVFITCIHSLIISRKDPDRENNPGTWFIAFIVFLGLLGLDFMYFTSPWDAQHTVWMDWIFGIHVVFGLAYLFVRIRVQVRVNGSPIH